MDDLSRLKQALTSTYRSFVYRTDNECPLTVLEALRRELPHLDPDSWDKRLRFGGVFVNGKPLLEDTQLAPPCMVEYFEPKYDLAHVDTLFPAFSPDQVIFEDEDLLVVCKPARLPCLPTREQRTHNLKAQLQHYLAEQSAAASLHLPSRLDTSVSGLVVASKAPRSHAALQRIYEHRHAKKRYLLEVSGIPAWREWQCREAIEKDPRHPVLRRISKDSGKLASTFFTVVGSPKRDPANGPGEGDRTLLEAQPLTGRTHQIRLHAQSLNLPIVGDNFYGGAIAPELRLISFGAAFPHPASGAPLSFELPRTFWPDWLSAAIDFNFSDAMLKERLSVDSGTGALTQNEEL